MYIFICYLPVVSSTLELEHDFRQYSVMYSGDLAQSPILAQYLHPVALAMSLHSTIDNRSI